MGKIKIGLQIHSVREDFDEQPAETLKKIAAMGYQGVELNLGGILIKKGPHFFVKALADAGLECYSVMIGWGDMAPEKLEEVIDYCKILKCETIVIGMLDLKPLAENPDYQFQLLEDVKRVAARIREAGFKTGFHNHDCDHLTTVDGEKTFFEFLFENITEDFMLLMDTGNCMGGKADPIELVKKYPGRTEIAHFKGYSSELKYVTPVWKAEIDSDELIRTLVEEGKTEKFSIEFGARGGYVPLERAEQSYVWLRDKLAEKGLN